MAAIVLGAGGYKWWQYSHTWISTDNAYVTGHVHQISPRIAGTVSEVLVRDNQEVKAGDVLVRLDPKDNEMRVNQAKSQISQAQAQQVQAEAQMARIEAELARSDSQISAADAQIAAAKANAEKARADFERLQKLVESKAISRQEFDAARAADASAQANLDAAAAGRISAIAQKKSTQSQLEGARAAQAAAVAARESAEVNLKDAELQLSYTTITAPTDGRIGRKSVEKGNRLSPGQALMAVVEPNIWVVANYKETQLAKMTHGQPVEMTIDAFSGHIFRGHVDSFSPASGAQFALLPPDNATGNFTKIVQRVPVKIRFDEQSMGDLKSRLAPGMSVAVEVNIKSAPAS